MSFWDLFRRKSKDTKNAAADSGAGFVPIIAASDASSAHSDTGTPAGYDAGIATSTDSGASSFGGDGGGASGGDGGGGAN